jgi:phosphoribosylformimino-5-aminoimidazole carboxamide ribotide isomerase
LVQLIDLDAAMGQGSNAELIKFFVSKLPCQVGGGIRSLELARSMLDLGARRVILGSALIRDHAINIQLANQLASELGPEHLVFGIDSKQGKVAISGWREITAISPLEMIHALDPFCCAFLYTHIDTEGLMTGLPLQSVLPLRRAATKQLIVAGGITTAEEISELDAVGVDAVVGMALYSGRLTLPATIPSSQ